MTTASPTFEQIRAQVGAIRRKKSRESIIGLSAPGRWAGAPVREHDGERFLIRQCDSPLAMRLALREPADCTVRVLITSLKDEDLDEDIRLRLARRRLFPIDNWQIVKAMFQAREIDPRIAGNGLLAEELLRWAPGEGYAPTANGFLDAERAWSVVLRERLGFTTGQPDLGDILEWATTTEGVRAWQAAPEALRQAAADWLTRIAGPAAGAVVNCMLAHAQPDAIPIGLASQVVFSDQGRSHLERAAGKMEERFFGGELPEPPVLARWSEFAVEVTRGRVQEPQSQRPLLTRADEILRAVGAEDFAYLSDVSPMGFDQRLERFGEQLTDILKSSRAPAPTAPLLDALQHLHAHDRAAQPGERERMDRLSMAVRLLRWMQTTPGTPDDRHDSLQHAARYHLAEGGFVDWARGALRAGDPVRALSRAYSQLFEQVTAIREGHARRFAELLRDWTAAGSSGEGLIPVERVLDDVVGPLAAEASLLVIVLDGMSSAVWRELLADLTHRHWTALKPKSTEANPPVIAAIPSVTELSRTSLLCGRLKSGASADEQKGFAEHPALASQGRRQGQPQLFHKAELQEPDDVVLAGDVRRAIEAKNRRVVGVVLNAVDDYLLKGDQLHVRWTREHIKTLSALLHEADSAGRLVVLLSDHGHVLDHGTKARAHENAGERWRPDQGEPVDGELRVKGHRVGVAGEESIIAAWSEKIRYGVKKNGYHGGLSPQEMVVPLTVLTSGASRPAGWTEMAVEPPLWWSEPEQAEGSVTAKTSPAPVAPADREPAAGPLFSHATTAPEPAGEQARSGEDAVAADQPWIDHLLASPIFATQKSLAGRAVPGDRTFASLLTALSERGGKMTTPALARAIGQPRHRLSGLLAVTERVLNVDGYPVLRRDEASDTVELDRELLNVQFGLL